jgi:hypothetical protein
VRAVVAWASVLVGCTPFDAALAGGGAADASSDAPGQVASACALDRPCANGTCVGGLCTAGASPCKALLAARSDAPSGVYEVSDATQVVRVYCDMASFGGGFMLVGRSVASGAGSFGWRVAAGRVDDDSAPYSLGLLGPLSALPFTEVVFGARGDAKEWGGNVFRHTVPADFLVAFQTTGTQQLPSTTMAGTCTPSSGQGPGMLSRLGLTGRKDHFFFSDQVNTSSFGFWPDGWDTNGANATPTTMCSYTGVLTGLQGMIFVR